MQSQRVKALIKLLEDPNEIVFSAVRSALLKEGISIVPILERAWDHIEDAEVRQRIDDIIHRIQFVDVRNSLINWLEDGSESMLYGAYLVARYQYADIEFNQINKRINELWRELRGRVKQAKTPVERVRVINSYFFDTIGFSKNIDKPFSHRNNCINDVLECLKGNNISLSILYSELSQRIGLPIRCVSLPQIVILCYLRDTVLDSDDEISSDNILFYINPSDKGAILNSDDIKAYLELHKQSKSDKSYLPCSNSEVVRRLLADMSYSFVQIEEPRATEVDKLINVIEKYVEEHGNK